MNEKQQQLTFDKGITNVPSDALCSDNALEESLGMVYDDGEHRVIQKPVATSPTLNNGELLYIHSYGGTDRYIVKIGSDIKWKTTETYTTLITLATGEEFLSAESIGNTLIISTSKSLYYFLWDSKGNATYKSLGNKLPEIQVTFSLDYTGQSDVTHTEPHIDATELFDGVYVHEFPITPSMPEPYVAGNKFKPGMYEDAKSALIGLVSMRLKEVKEAKRFAFPFWARAAVRLYDGSYTHISNPVLLLPTVLNNWNIFACDIDDNTIPKAMDAGAGGFGLINYMPYSAKLKYTVTYPDGFDKDAWDDIIKGIDIFVSTEVKNFDMEGTWTIQNCFNYPDAEHDMEHTEVNPIFQSQSPLVDACQPLYNNNIENLQIPVATDQTTWNTYYKPAPYTQYEIIKKLLDASTFYNIVEHDWEDLEAQTHTYDATTRIQKGTLENLTTQPQLDNDDFFSWAPIMGAVMKTYNSRLHLANITRGFFDGFTHFSFTKYSANDLQQARMWKYYVHINSESGERLVLASFAQARIPEIADIWFYYPDPRAYKVDIIDVTNGNRLVNSLPLKEHPSLNGAYYFERLPGTGETGSLTPISGNLPTPITTAEHLEDQLAVSEVNNPFTFNAKGYITVGMGAIKGLATQTMSLGENEHGIHPLSVFSEKGISLLRLNNEGVYIRSDEICREVCNNPKSITETDGPVFFSSDKGLMVLLGNQAKCVSEQLSGKSAEPFANFLKTAVIAYDYRDSLLWILNTSSAYAWVYSIKSGTFGRYLVESAQVQQQVAPLLQSSPRRSAENATLAFVTLPFTGSHTMDGTENTDNDISHLDTSSPVELYYAGDTIKKFYLKGISTVDSQETYFTEGWTFEGHTESEYYNLYGAIIPGTLFLDDNGHYWVQGGANAILIDLRTTNPALWDQLPANGSHYFLGGESFVSYSDIDLSKEVYLEWGQNLPAGAASRWVLRGSDQNGDTCYVLSGWTFKGHTESDYYDDLTTLEVNTGVLFVTGTQYKISTEGNIFRTLTVAEEPTPTEYITPSVNSLSFAQTGETKTFGISSNVSWNISKSSGSDWLAVSPDNGSNDDTISVEAEANSGDSSRTATLTISGGSASATVNISQAGTTENKITVVNNYPDYLIQLNNTVYSLIERPNINEDDTEYSGTIITRPMKLENALALKSIMQIRHILQMDGTMTMQIFASNNLDNWVELHSLRGTPWKYYKFRFNFSDMKATDRFAGTMLITQERRTNKLR